MPKKKEKWHLYLVRCADKTIYTGIAKDVKARVERHNQGRGAKYTSIRTPVKLIYQEEHNGRVAAMKREMAIKRWPQEKKIELSKKYKRPSNAAKETG